MSLVVTGTLSDATFSVPGLRAEGNAATRFGYDATEARGKRKTAPTYSGSEDTILDATKRRKVLDNGRDIARNFAVACWMIRRHLDYVASFEFHCRTGNVAFDTQVETFMERWSRAYNCDAAGRHPLPKMIRIAETRRVIDGDVGLLKMADGRLQGIEADRIKNPIGEIMETTRSGMWVHGVKVDDAGRAATYAIHRREKTRLTFDRLVPAHRMCMLGYFDRFDQVRGISPLVSGLNPLRDVYENFDLALAKAKLNQLFAMAIFSEATQGTGEHTVTEEDEDTPLNNRYEVDFGRGPIKLELDPGDRAEFLESKNPSREFQDFTTLVLQVALKALDIPFSFYNESFTNFFGSRAAWLHYQRSCKPKQDDIRELLTRLTLWRLMLAILDGELKLPAGMVLDDVSFEWVATGMPWWDPAKEINGDLLAIGAGLDNPQRIVKERGRGDWYDNVDRIAEALEYARKKKVPLSFLASGQAASKVVEDQNEQDRKDKADQDRDAKPSDKKADDEDDDE